MVSCAKRTCPSRDGVDKKKLTGITFHRFPINLERRQKWIQFVNRGSWVPTKYSVLCSKHFAETHFDRTSKCYVRLKDDAVPSLETTQEQVQEISNSQTKVEESISLPSTSTGIVSNPSNSTASFVQEEIVIVIPRNKKLFSKLRNALRVIRDKNRKLALIRKKLFRRNKLIAHIKDILIKLREKNYMQEEHLDVVISKLGGPQ